MTDAKTRIEAYLAERDRRQMNDRDGGHIHGLGVNTLVLHDSDLREVINLMPRWHRIDDAEPFGEYLVGCWVDQNEHRRWSCWWVWDEFGTRQWGCDGEFGDTPSHFMEIIAPPEQS